MGECQRGTLHRSEIHQRASLNRRQKIRYSPVRIGNQLLPTDNLSLQGRVRKIHALSLRREQAPTILDPSDQCGYPKKCLGLRRGHWGQVVPSEAQELLTVTLQGRPYQLVLLQSAGDCSQDFGGHAESHGFG